jgi:hypothetical protein
VAGANAAGVVGAPIGPEATGAGLITAVVPALLSLSGLGGVSIIPRLLSGFLGLFGRQITKTS